MNELRVLQPDAGDAGGEGDPQPVSETEEGGTALHDHGVRGDRPVGHDGPQGPLSRVPASPAASTEPAKAARPASASTNRGAGYGDVGRLVADLLAPLKKRRGQRIVCIGTTGSGKSFALRALAAAAIPLVDVNYIHDDTEDFDKWNGGNIQIRRDIEECKHKVLLRRREGGSNAIVLTGDPHSRIRLYPEDAALDAWDLSAKGITSTIYLDELRRACSKPQRWHEPDGEIPRIYTEGRKPGISIFAASQFPQDIPREGLDLSQLLIFRLDGRALASLHGYGLVTDEQANMIPRLQEGDFVVKRDAFEPDRNRYRF